MIENGVRFCRGLFAPIMNVADQQLARHGKLKILKQHDKEIGRNKGETWTKTQLLFHAMPDITSLTKQ